MSRICQRKMQKNGENVLGHNVHYFYESWGKMSVGQNVLRTKCPLAVFFLQLLVYVVDAKNTLVGPVGHFKVPYFFVFP